MEVAYTAQAQETDKPYKLFKWFKMVRTAQAPQPPLSPPTHLQPFKQVKPLRR